MPVPSRRVARRDGAPAVMPRVPFPVTSMRCLGRGARRSASRRSPRRGACSVSRDGLAPRLRERPDLGDGRARIEISTSTGRPMAPCSRKVRGRCPLRVRSRDLRQAGPARGRIRAHRSEECRSGAYGWRRPARRPSGAAIRRGRGSVTARAPGGALRSSWRQPRKSWDSAGRVSSVLSRGWRERA